MPFNFSHSARKFFNRIGVKANTDRSRSTTGEFATMFDAYWLCAQVGILKNKFEQPPSSTPMITDRFVGASAEFMHRIRGVAFYEYCRSHGLLNTEQGVLSEMKDFFSDESKELNTAGYTLLNGFAQGGYLLIYQIMGDHCEDLCDFLFEYQDIIHGD